MRIEQCPVTARYVVEAFDRFGGKHCITASLAKYLGYLRRPFSESTLFGLAGGIGFSFRDVNSGAVEFSTRFSGSRPLEFETGLLARIGADAELLEFDDCDEGHAALLMQLEICEPAMLYGDMGELPHFALPQGVHFGAHAFLVYAVDDENAWISDCCEVPVVIPLERLMAARFAECGDSSPRGRMLRLNLPLRPVDLEQSIRTAIARCLRQLLNPPARGEGLAALERWPVAMASWSGLDAGLLFRRLRALYEQIEIAGTGGGAFRRLYSDFLGESTGIVEYPPLREAQELYARCAEAWIEVAHAALPHSDRTLTRVRSLIEERARLFANQQNRQRMHEIAREIVDAGHEWVGKAEISSRDLLEGLRAAAGRCAAAENAAARALGACWR